MTWLKNNKDVFIILLGTCLAIFGCFLIIISWLVEPQGTVDNSILVIIGEVFAFSGTLLGIGGATVVKTKINSEEIGKLKDKIKLLEELNER